MTLGTFFRRQLEAALIVVGLLLAVPPGAATEFVGTDLPRHALIFSQHSDGARSDYDVWWMCADGTQVASLVVEPGNQIQLAVSPDGSELAYTSGSTGSRDIWRRPFGRGEAVRVTDHEAEDSGPVWSPDGSRMAFFSTRDAEKPELYIMRLDDGSIVRRTHDAFHDSGASWSPDGRTIVFTRYFPGEEDHDGAGEIMQLDLETGEQTQLSRLGGYNGGLHHAPDGRTLVFHRATDEGAELWMIDADGSHPRPVTDTRIDEYSPRWSPDGRWISFTAGTGNDSQGTFDIWLMRPDGSDRHVVYRGPNTQGWQRWRPGDQTCR